MTPVRRSQRSRRTQSECRERIRFASPPKFLPTIAPTVVWNVLRRWLRADVFTTEDSRSGISCAFYATVTNFQIPDRYSVLRNGNSEKSSRSGFRIRKRRCACSARWSSRWWNGGTIAELAVWWVQKHVGKVCTACGNIFRYGSAIFLVVGKRGFKHLSYFLWCYTPGLGMVGKNS